MNPDDQPTEAPIDPGHDPLIRDRRAGPGPRSARFMPGCFHPRPGYGRAVRMVRVQSAIELRLTLRHPEHLLLTLCVPVLLLVGLTVVPVIPLPAPRVNAVLPSVLALAVVSTAFTAQAIALGFDRRYGVIYRLAATAVPRWLLCAGRMAASCGVLAVQVVVLSGVALALGWRPSWVSAALVLAVLPLGWAAFGAWGVCEQTQAWFTLNLAVPYFDTPSVRSTSSSTCVFVGSATHEVTGTPAGQGRHNAACTKSVGTHDRGTPVMFSEFLEIMTPRRVAGNQSVPSDTSGSRSSIAALMIARAERP